MYCKKFLIMLLAIVAVTALSVSAVTLDSANKDGQGILYTLNTSDKTATVGNGTGTYCNSGYVDTGTVEIPQTVEKDDVTYTVTEIGYYAFKRCDAVVSVSIPSTVKTIANCAFFDCVNLKSVTLSEGLEKIGDSAFAGCVKLEGISIPTTVNEIGYSAFYSCKALKSVALPEGIIKIGNRAFACSDSLTDVSLPKTVTTVDTSAFNSCSALKSITLPLNVATLGESVFSGCTSLENVFVYKNLSSIGNFAFWNCPKVTVYLQYEGTAAIEYMKNNEIDYAVKGDIDGNGEVNISDAIGLKQYLASSNAIKLDEKVKIAVDTARDGDLNISDAISLEQYIASRETVNLD